MIPAPAEQSIVDTKSEHDVDEKLRLAAERNHARGASHALAPAVDITARVLEMSKHAAAPAEPTFRGGGLWIPPPREIPPDVRAAIVPARFTDASFDSYQPQNPTQVLALRVARRWVERARAGEGHMLALIGPTGTGKSHLLYSAVNELLGAHYPLSCFSRPWYRLADELRYGTGNDFPYGGQRDAHEVRSTLWSFRIVMLDEVRPTAGTGFDDTELAKFSCWAYDARVAVFISTNVSPLEKVMGPPAASRYAEVTVEGPDWRQK